MFLHYHGRYQPLNKLIQRSWSSTSKILIPWVFLNFIYFLMIHHHPNIHIIGSQTIFQKQNDGTTPDLISRNKTKSDWPSLPFKKPKIKIAQNFTNTKRNETKRTLLKFQISPVNLALLHFRSFFLSFSFSFFFFFILSFLAWLLLILNSNIFIIPQKALH